MLSHPASWLWRNSLFRLDPRFVNHLTTLSVLSYPDFYLFDSCLELELSECYHAEPGSFLTFHRWSSDLSVALAKFRYWSVCYFSWCSHVHSCQDASEFLSLIACQPVRSWPGQVWSACLSVNSLTYYAAQLNSRSNQPLDSLQFLKKASQLS